MTVLKFIFFFQADSKFYYQGLPREIREGIGWEDQEL